MSAFRIETHAHTNIVSPCGQLSPAELVANYVHAGYSGLIVTDHLAATLPLFNGLSFWPDRVHAYFSGYRAVRDAARHTALVVYPGLELTFSDLPGIDFLVYGIDEDQLVEMPDLCRLDPSRFRPIARAAGALVFQAHPFRGRGPVDASLIDGVEVFNGNPRHDFGNERAAAFAERNRLLTISGSDAHQLADVGRGGITLPEMPASIHEFVSSYRESSDCRTLIMPDPVNRTR